MANVTIFVGSSLNKNDTFRRTLEETLGRVADLKVSAQFASTQDCTPPVILQLTDFGGFSLDDGKLVTETARHLARVHFDVPNDKVNVTISGDFKG